MLQSWNAINDISQNEKPQNLSQCGTVGETHEAREGRVRDAYASALALHASGAYSEAREAYIALAKELTKWSVNWEFQEPRDNSTARGRKRTRDGHHVLTESEKDPEWLRLVRYGVQRNLGDVLCDSGSFIEGLAAYAIALDIDPGDMVVWLRAGKAALSCGRLHVARRAFEQALQVRPDHWLPLEYYRKTLDAIGDADEDVREDCATQRETADEAVNEILLAREKYFHMEREAASILNTVKCSVEVTELTWISVIDALGNELKNRLSSSQDVSIGAPVTLLRPSRLASNASASSEMEIRTEDPNALNMKEDEHIVEKKESADQLLREPLKNASGIETSQLQDKTIIALEAETSDQDGVVTIVDVDNGETKERGVSSDDRRMDGCSNQETSKNKETHEVLDDGCPRNRTKLDDKPQELRKSKRQAEIEQREHQRDRLRNRETVSNAHGPVLSDWGHSELMLSFIPAIPVWCISKPKTSPTNCFESDVDLAQDFVDVSRMTTAPKNNFNGQETVKLNPKTSSERWNRRTSDAAEACQVEEFIRFSHSIMNGGPIDLLSRIFDHLTSSCSEQYMPHIARVWLLLRCHCSALNSQPPAIVAFVVESLLTSGDKIGKIKQSCYNEALRLLSLSNCATRFYQYDDIIADNSSNLLETAILSVRLLWLRSQLAERMFRMQESRDYALACYSALSALRSVQIDQLPAVAGPLLTGIALTRALSIVSKNYKFCEQACRVEEARSLLKCAKKGHDRKLAGKAAGLLAPDALRMADCLNFDKIGQLVDEACYKHSLCCLSKLYDTYSFSPVDGLCKKPPSAQSKAQSLVQNVLDVLIEACSFCEDAPGELACYAIIVKRLVLEHHAHETFALIGKSSTRDERRIPDNYDGESLLSKLSTIVTILRKFVASVKNICSNVDTSRVVGDSGISPLHAVSLAAKSLVSASHMLQARIPPLPMTSASQLDLNASQKNQRLAFTRAMLGFSRCINFMVRAVDTNEITAFRSRGNGTAHTLNVLNFALRVLVPRGCVREEGTSGALIRFYLNSLTDRLYELALTEHGGQPSDEPLSSAFDSEMLKSQQPNRSRTSRETDGKETQGPESGSDGSAAGDDETEEFAKMDWEDVDRIRGELAQCYRCLFKLSDLEMLARDGPGNETRWLLDGCSLSQRLGLSYPSGDSLVGRFTMDVDTCRGAYCFYRKHLFQGLKNQWREGKRSRRARDITAEIAESMPVDPPPGVPSVPLPVLDAVVTLALEGGGSAVDTLKAEWTNALNTADKQRPQCQSGVQAAQFARMYYEVYILHVMSNLATYESEFKKQKSVERRKRPKETVERLINAVSNDCVAALRSRPWSAATWILLGRVFSEVADVALDERENAASTFGLYRPDELAAGDLGDPIVAILGRAEGCFRLAEALARQQWNPDPMKSLSPSDQQCLLDADAYDGKPTSKRSAWGTDQDLFEQYGLVDDPNIRVRALRAAIQFGKTAVLVMKLREERYRSRHWRSTTLSPRCFLRKEEILPPEVNELVIDAQKSLERGIRYAFSGAADRAYSSPAISRSEWSNLSTVQPVAADASLTGEFDEKPHFSKSGKTALTEISAFSSLSWYYTMQRAKLCRKLCSSPFEYLELFANAVCENTNIRTTSGEPPDIEPFYKLHAIRLKLLLENDKNESCELLDAIERHSFSRSTENDSQQTAAASPVQSLLKQEMTFSERRKAIARDVIKAMKYCRHQKTLHPHSDFFYKAVYYRALAFWYVLEDQASALAELGLMFRGEAAAKAVDPNGDGVHRGYFFTIWNYRYTDTGYETAVETERKYLRWRNKLLGLYGTFLRDNGDLRTLAGVISRLKRRHPDDLPVDGAILDDFVQAYGKLSLQQVQASSKEFEVPTMAVSERALRRTWDVYTESVRLVQGMKRVRLYVERERNFSGGLKAVLDSQRPYCLLAAASALHAECLRLQAAIEDRRADAVNDFEYPVNGTEVVDISPDVFRAFAASIEFCAKRWPVENKLLKLLRRRIEEYRTGGLPAQVKLETGISEDDRARTSIDSKNVAGTDVAKADHHILLTGLVEKSTRFPPVVTEIHDVCGDTMETIDLQ